jgi:hypothetical protein
MRDVPAYEQTDKTKDTKEKRPTKLNSHIIKREIYIYIYIYINNNAASKAGRHTKVRTHTHIRIYRNIVSCYARVKEGREIRKIYDTSTKTPTTQPRTCKI